jgi:glycosyltransferase involved in cell wall biosynthesis
MSNVVSVIITTKNEETNIRACLESVKKQTHNNNEIIVVDNASSDRTKAIAKSFGASVYDQGPERSAQRNFGAKKAKGAYLLFLDADMILTPTVIKECVSLIDNQLSDIKAIVIPEQSIGTGFWAACKTLERSFYVGVDWIEAARFYRKDTFKELGGYDEKLTGPEDFDLPQRLKARFGKNSVGRTQAYIIHNEGNLALGKTLKKKYYYAHSFYVYRAKTMNADYARKQSNILLRYWLFFRRPRKLFEHPIIGLGMLFLKTAEFVAGSSRLAIR